MDRESPSTESNACLVQSNDGRLKVVFTHVGDRFAHQIYVDDRLVASSIEGDADDLWPTSPPIQQLSLESIQGRSVALGVGSAGRAHWSISVDPVGNDTIRFDWACRCSTVPTQLGCTYRATAPSDQESHWMIQPKDAKLSTAQAPDVVPATSQDLRWPTGTRCIRIDVPNPASGTAQWSYDLTTERP